MLTSLLLAKTVSIESGVDSVIEWARMDMTGEYHVEYTIGEGVCLS